MLFFIGIVREKVDLMSERLDLLMSERTPPETTTAITATNTSLVGSGSTSLLVEQTQQHTNTPLRKIKSC